MLASSQLNDNLPDPEPSNIFILRIDEKVVVTPRQSSLSLALKFKVKDLM